MTDEPTGGSGRSRRAEAKAAKAHAKALRPWYKKKRWIGALGLVALIAIIAATAGGGDDDTDVASNGDDAAAEGDSGVESNSFNETNPPQADIGEVACNVDETLGWMRADVTVTNNSSGRSNYTFEVVFESQDGSEQLDSSFAAVNGLEPGQSTTTEASTATEPPAEGFTCRVTEVERYAD